MAIDILTDGHIHTNMCHHAVGTMEEYVIAAMAKQLQRIFFLEHLEEEINYFQTTWLTEKDFDNYFAEGKRLQQDYADQIEIGLGVEVGYNPGCPEKIIERLQKRVWDRIGISYHFCRLPDQKQHLNLLSRKQTNIDTFQYYGTADILSRYFAALIEAVQLIPGDVLCHLDAGLRHYPRLSFEKSHLDQIEQLLNLLKQKNIALEVNTSGYDIRGNPFPMPNIIRQALELGITIEAGSDAHNPSEVGRHFDKLVELTKAT